MSTPPLPPTPPPYPLPPKPGNPWDREHHPSRALTAAAALVAAVLLSACGGSPVPAPSTPPSPTSAPATPRTVTPGAYCRVRGETAVTAAGTPMVCTGPGELRWRQVREAAATVDGDAR